MASHDGKIAVVTGGASGIGLATVEVLAQSGAVVLAVDRDEEKLANLAKRDGIYSLHGDVTDAATWDRVVSMATSDLGGVPTLLVSNAAIVRVGSILELTDEDWQQVTMDGALEWMGTSRTFPALGVDQHVIAL